jgi:hypothetical protein
MARQNGSRGSRLNAEEQSLEKQRSEILRKQVELERRLKQLPVVIEKQQEKQRQLKRHRAVVAAPAISPDIRPLGRRSRKGTQKRLPSSQIYAAQVKTLLLIAILVGILVLLWNAMPS